MFIQIQSPVIEPQGAIDQHTAGRFEAEVLMVLSQEQPAVLLIDMSQVESVDNYGLMALVSILSTAQNTACTLQLCRVSPVVRIILEVSSLDQLFEILDDRPAAVPLAA